MLQRDLTHSAQPATSASRRFGDASRPFGGNLPTNFGSRRFGDSSRRFGYTSRRFGDTSRRFGDASRCFGDAPSTSWTIAEWPTNIHNNMYAGAETKEEEERVLNGLINMYNADLEWAEEEDTGKAVYGLSNDSQDKGEMPQLSTPHTNPHTQIQVHTPTPSPPYTQIHPHTPTPSKLRNGLYHRFVADACAAAAAAAAERALWYLNPKP